MKKLLCVLLAVCGFTLSGAAADKKIIFIAGKPSHGPLAHEHRAGCLLFQKCLTGFPGVVTEVYTNGWPSDESVFDGAAAVVLYSDGGGGHPLLQGDRLQTIGALMKKGVGFGSIHYAVEPTIEKGQKEYLDWIGGAFEINWSVNPHWDADFKVLPEHAVTRGVKPFKANDEWYFNMRFRDGMAGVTPILTDVPPDSTMNRKDDAHGGNPEVRKKVAAKEPQHVMWVTERADGGRGFGFTGGHSHLNWGMDDQRKLVLNAIVWLAKVEVPKGGVESKVTQEELMENLDPKNAPPKPAKKKQ